MARKHTYAQHFLRSPKLVAELVGHSNIRPKDTVYDYGAGSGVISSVLARRAARVVAIEIEAEAIATLQRNLGGVDNVSIVKADILTYPLPDSDYKVFSNPPFMLTSSLVQRLCFTPNPPKAVYLIVQRQFARKIVPSDSRFTSALGVQLYPRFTSRIRRPLRKTDFTPPPAVDTVLLELKRREQPLIAADRIDEFVTFVGERFENPKRLTAELRASANVSAEKKPSEISPQVWIDMFTVSYRAS